MNEPELIVLGLDGGSWTFLEPWLEEGILPNLHEIRENHLSGHLESYLPPVTSPNWKCYSTGLSPGQLGVYWWETLDWNQGRIRTPGSGDYRGAELWDYLGDEGLESLVVNMPTTFPPSKISGTLIAGGPTASETGYTEPDDFEEKLKSRYGYATLPESLDFIHSEPRRAVKEIRELMELRFRVAEDELKNDQYDFLQITLYLINVLQHHFGHKQPVREAWEWIDRKIGEWREHFPDVPLVLLSDHGCNEIDVQFNVNEWLIREGYLDAGRTFDQTLLSKLGLNKDRLARLLARIGLKKAMKSLLPKNLRNLFPTEDDSVMGPGKNRLVDWESSRAYAFGQGPVFVNPILPEPDLRSTKEALLEEFDALTDPSGRAVAESVLTGSSYYGEDAVGTRPDLVLDQASGLHISNSIGFDEVFQSPEKWEAENARQGLYAWVDPASETRLSDPEKPVKISDLMPSILGRMTGKIPEGIDGDYRLVNESEPTPDTVPPLSEDRSSDVEEESTREKLEGLGYL